MRIVCVILAMFFFTESAVSQDKSNISFSVSKKEESSIFQIVGLCDGTKSSQELTCSMIRVSLDKGDQLKRKVMGGGLDQCFLSIASDGQKIVFKKSADKIWIANSEPSILCGGVESYKLESIADSRFFQLTISLKLTDLSSSLCKIRKSMDETTATYTTSIDSLSCDGVKTGPNPGF